MDELFLQVYLRYNGRGEDLEKLGSPGKQIGRFVTGVFALMDVSLVTEDQLKSAQNKHKSVHHPTSPPTPARRATRAASRFSASAFSTSWNPSEMTATGIAYTSTAQKKRKLVMILPVGLKSLISTYQEEYGVLLAGTTLAVGPIHSLPCRVPLMKICGRCGPDRRRRGVQPGAATQGGRGGAGARRRGQRAGSGPASASRARGS